ncbi:hypothetical protein ACRAWD_27355 [Caulobacter segnis]
MSESLRALVEQKVDQSRRGRLAAADLRRLAAFEAETAVLDQVVGQTARELDIETLRRIREVRRLSTVVSGLPDRRQDLVPQPPEVRAAGRRRLRLRYPRRARPAMSRTPPLHRSSLPEGRVTTSTSSTSRANRFLRAVEGSFLGESNTLMRHVIHTGQALDPVARRRDPAVGTGARRPVATRRQRRDGSVDFATLPPPQALIDRVDTLKRLISQARKAADTGDAKAQAKLKTLVRERRQPLEGGVEQALQRLAAKHEELGDYIGGIGLHGPTDGGDGRTRRSWDLDPSIDAYAVFDRSRDAERKKPIKLHVHRPLEERRPVPSFRRRPTADPPSRCRAALRPPTCCESLRREPHKADAFAMLNTLRPGVARQIDEWFALASFQFATAFEGVARGSKTINYRLGHVGVTELIRALLRLKEHTEKRRAGGCCGSVSAAASSRGYDDGVVSMNRHGGRRRLIASAALVTAAMLGWAWASGLTPSHGVATVGAAPTRGGGPWIERLGLSQLEPWSSPTPAFAEGG